MPTYMSSAPAGRQRADAAAAQESRRSRTPWSRASASPAAGSGAAWPRQARLDEAESARFADSVTGRECPPPPPVIDWLLDSDPAIRWQVMRDLLDAPEAAWAAERARVETEGWGARLLACQDPDGQWAGGAFAPADFDWSRIEADGQPWTATCFALQQLRPFGLDPASESRAAHRRARRRATPAGRKAASPTGRARSRSASTAGPSPTAPISASTSTPIVARLLGERQPDGGWNCERANGSVRSSFHSTINVLEGLLAHEKATGGTPRARAARRARARPTCSTARLFRRLSTGAPADERYLALPHPNRWRHDILRGLDYFRDAAAPDRRRARPAPRRGDRELRRRRLPDGRWPLDWTLRGATWFDVDDGPRPALALDHAPRAPGPALVRSRIDLSRRRQAPRPRRASDRGPRRSPAAASVGLQPRSSMMTARCGIVATMPRIEGVS